MSSLSSARDMPTATRLAHCGADLSIKVAGGQRLGCWGRHASGISRSRFQPRTIGRRNSARRDSHPARIHSAERTPEVHERRGRTRPATPPLRRCPPLRATGCHRSLFRSSKQHPHVGMDAANGEEAGTRLRAIWHLHGENCHRQLPRASPTPAQTSLRSDVHDTRGCAGKTSCRMVR